jgi:hypothetical protein
MDMPLSCGTSEGNGFPASFIKHHFFMDCFPSTPKDGLIEISAGDEPQRTSHHAIG